jgi:hypothetical protein
LIFSFRTYQSPTPVVSLGGSRTRVRPVISITAIGPTGQDSRPILVDSGADDIVFPIDMAARLGVDLTAAAQRQAGGIGTHTQVGLLYAPVILEVTDKVETCRWRTIVGFAQTKMRIPLFGIAGGLEHFLTTLNVQGNQLILIPQPTLPTTQDGRP